MQLWPIQSITKWVYFSWVCIVFVSSHATSLLHIIPESQPCISDKNRKAKITNNKHHHQQYHTTHQRHPCSTYCWGRSAPLGSWWTPGGRRPCGSAARPPPSSDAGRSGGSRSPGTYPSPARTAARLGGQRLGGDRVGKGGDRQPPLDMMHQFIIYVLKDVYYITLHIISCVSYLYIMNNE